MSCELSICYMLNYSPCCWKIFFPTDIYERVLHSNYAVVVGQCPMKYMPFFGKFGQGQERQVSRGYSRVIAMKSDGVSAIITYHKG